MKHWTTALSGIITLMLLTNLATAQGQRGPKADSPGAQLMPWSDGQAQGQGGQHQQQQGQGPPQGFLRMPLMAALDANGDGELSAAEIRRAVVALRTLDKNRDGKITRDELQPQSGAPGQGGPGQGGPGGSSFEQIFGQGIQAGQGGPIAGLAGEGPGAMFANKLMGLDQNGDGKISPNEVPQQMPPQIRQFMSRGDANRDGAIDAAEAANIGKHFMKAMSAGAFGKPGGVIKPGGHVVKPGGAPGRGSGAKYGGSPKHGGGKSK